MSWNWLRAQTIPRTQEERPRSGRLSMMYFISTWPFWAGGGFRMVEGLLGIQENQSNWNTGQTYRYQHIYGLYSSWRVCKRTCPKLTAACCAEAVKITTVRNSTNCSRVFRESGNSVNIGYRFNTHAFRSCVNTAYSLLACKHCKHVTSQGVIDRSQRPTMVTTPFFKFKFKSTDINLPTHVWFVFPDKNSKLALWLIRLPTKSNSLQKVNYLILFLFFYVECLLLTRR